MRILFLSRWFPYPPDNGSRIRIYNILKQLSAQHEISLISFHESPAMEHAGAEHCTSVRVVPYRPFRPASVKALLGLVALEPRSFVDTYCAEFAEAASEECRRSKVDLVVASELGMMPYALELDGVPAILEDLEVSLFQDAARRRGPGRLRSQLAWFKLRAYLGRELRRFAACTVVSEQERRLVASVVPAYPSLHVVPNAVDLDQYVGDFGAPRPNSLAFCGALTYDANHDAIQHLLTDIYPAIRRTAPDVSLTITGSTDGVDVTALGDHPGVHFAGHVPDPRPVIAQSWASVVPLRLGGGTRLKILESMALGTPVVSTSKGAEGLDVEDGHDILIANEPRAFADQVRRLLESPDLRNRIAEGGRRLVAERFNWTLVGQELSALVGRTAGRTAA